jgi:hypothetical protein
MKLSDYAWNKLEAIAKASDISRTDVIEEFTREEVNEQKIILKAIEKFIKTKKADWALGLGCDRRLRPISVLKMGYYECCHRDCNLVERRNHIHNQTTAESNFI